MGNAAPPDRGAIAMTTNVWPGVIERYRDWMDLAKDVRPVTLLEGNTPLIPMPAFARELGADELHIKFEGLNPSGSFKDRGMTAAMSMAVHDGAAAVICASTGNTAASAAAYAARAGLRCIVLVPRGKVATGKLGGAIAHAAEVIQIEGSFDEALAMVTQLTQERPIALVNSINPYRLEGQKTAAFEICDALGRAPDWLALPVGNAGNITSYWMGFSQAHARHETGLPRILGVQAAGAAPLVVGHAIENPETVATAIRIGRPARGEEALRAAQESHGQIIAVPDPAILDAQRDLAKAGLWVEPASAAGLAGLRQQVAAGDLDLAGLTVVCVCTGHGLKDPEAITSRASEPRVIPAEMHSLRAMIDS
jgi:threonine synthase